MVDNIYFHIGGFALCSGLIIFAGSRLSVYGDRIAELTGLGKAWIGLILMASITSLPELITGLSSVVIVKAPNLAAGDVFGSCIFNLLILSVLDALQKKPITSLVRNTHIFAGACGIILIAIAALGIILSDKIPPLGWFSSITPVIVSVYLISVWLIYLFEQKLTTGSTGEKNAGSNSLALRRTLMLYAANAVLVVGSAIFLPYFGQHIAEKSGLGNTFFGTLFLAASTSLPELVVSVSAMRMGSLDMAVGSLFGSNIFNILILGLDDIFYREGSLFAGLNPEHLISIMFVMMMTAVVSIGLLFRVQRKRFVLAADTFVIMVLYAILMTILYFLR